MGARGGWLIKNKIAGRVAANDFFVVFIFWVLPLSAISAAYAIFIFGSNIGDLLKVREIEVARKTDIAPE